MQDLFQAFSKSLFQNLQGDEVLSLALTAEKSLFMRLNQAKVRQVTSVNQGVVTFTFIHNQRNVTYYIPFGSDQATNLEIGLKALDRCREEARQLPADPFCPEITCKANSEEHHKGSFPGDTDWMDALSPKLKGLDCAGLLTAGSVVRANMNSLGQSHWFDSDSFCADFSFYTPSQKAVKLVYADKTWSPEIFGQKLDFAKEQLKHLETPNKILEPGRYRTYFAPDATAGFLSMLSWNGVSAASYHQGQSAFKPLKDGEEILSPLFTLGEDFTQGTTPRFNSLGELAPKALPIVEKGTLKNLLISTRSAKEYTLDGNYAEEGEGLRSPRIEVGTLREADVLQRLGTGLYVSNVHYLNWSDLNKGRITGMTRYACFWVEGGKIMSPIKDMRFDETLYHFWGKGLLGLTDEAALIPSTDSYDHRSVGGSFAPGMLVEDFSYTL